MDRIPDKKIIKSEELAADVARFLEQGGTIHRVPEGATGPKGINCWTKTSEYARSSARRKAR